ncbi:putative cell wall assembly regulator [Wickerhamomyces ciferrii]|uniref:Cell wall assembly regulator n=1 Tax=Wickerhamomyces ciferrii (strain ATCC 14091 / BCRC 22168 / CBS 111 / JCM 3599 / NBRC 0793 / NRRL Y-1031 F-60-10) TaxID=1206466 RepID=K0KI94_WICCF|nr:putative cell wall assembly regulator [Wickerhamomyces ciferrii]CCH40868.1 putative cell wall assembly regulator [Wickerhamomyces ciferrii]
MVSEVEESINAIKTLIGEKFPNLRNIFQEGIPSSEINDFESEYNIKLPKDVVKYLQLVNGESPYEEQNQFMIGVFLGLEMLSLDEIKREMNVWKQVVDENPDFEEMELETYPKGFVSPVYCDANNWIGLTTDGSGNSIGIDLNPGPQGKIGQVIVWGRDYMDERIVLFDTWSCFLEKVVKDLQNDKIYKIEDNAFEMLDGENDEIYGNYMDYLFETTLKRLRSGK